MDLITIIAEVVFSILKWYVLGVVAAIVVIKVYNLLVNSSFDEAPWTDMFKSWFAILICIVALWLWFQRVWKYNNPLAKLKKKFENNKVGKAFVKFMNPNSYEE